MHVIGRKRDRGRGRNDDRNERVNGRVRVKEGIKSIEFGGLCIHRQHLRVQSSLNVYIYIYI